MLCVEWTNEYEGKIQSLVVVAAADEVDGGDPSVFVDMFGIPRDCEE